MKQTNSNAKSVYKLHEIFNSIEGEFPFAGTYSTFIRFNKCNFDCSFCDTMYNPHIIDSYEFSLDKILQYVENTNNITFTGGEPTLFSKEIVDITNNIFKTIYINRINIETNGSMLHLIKNDIIPYLPEKFRLVPQRFNVIWSPKFINDKTIEIMFENLYEHFDVTNTYIKIVGIPELEDVITNFIETTIKLYGITSRSKIALMPLTKGREFDKKSVNFILRLIKEYRINFSPRLHVWLDIQ